MTSSWPFVPNVLVSGYGTIGTPILETLTSPQFQARVKAFLLVRPASLADPSKTPTLDRLRTRGVTMVEGDLEAGVPALTALLRANHINTVISVVGTTQLASQPPLIEAAKEAGVRHFIPSEFGIDTARAPLAGPLAPMLAGKKGAQQLIKDAGLDCTLVFVGAFAEWVTDTPVFGLDLVNHTIAAPGSFDTKITVSSVKDVAYVTALSVLDTPAASNEAIYVGELLTYHQIADIVEAATGKKLTRSIVSQVDAQLRIDANPGDFVARIAGAAGSTDSTGYWPVSQTYLAKYHPEYKTISFADVVAAKLKS